MNDTIHDRHLLPAQLASTGQWVAPVLELWEVALWQGDHPVVRDVTFTIGRHQVTALIGPSGSGTSILLRALNRMTDHLSGLRVDGRITFQGTDLYAPDVDPARVCRLIGLVAAPALLRRSIHANVVYAANASGSARDDLVRWCLQRVGLWPEVNARLRRSAKALSASQQRLLCLARTLATRPQVLLLDNPCAGLGSADTARIEDVIGDLANEHTIVLATGNRHQAARLAHRTAIFTTAADAAGVRYGQLVEYGDTRTIFTTPHHPSTADFLSGRTS